MATKLLRTLIPMEVIFKNGTFIVTEIRKLYEYQDGKRTNKLAGYVYDAVDTDSFDKISVKIKGQTEPLMPPEKLAELRENGERITVEFINGYDKLYNRNSDGKWSVEDSFSAEDVRLAETVE